MEFLKVPVRCKSRPGLFILGERQIEAESIELSYAASDCYRKSIRIAKSDPDSYRDRKQIVSFPYSGCYACVQLEFVLNIKYFIFKCLCNWYIILRKEWDWR